MLLTRHGDDARAYTPCGSLSLNKNLSGSSKVKTAQKSFLRALWSPHATLRFPLSQSVAASVRIRRGFAFMSDA